jgi:spore coat polysaccharide biosynthesis protein SpsF
MSSNKVSNKILAIIQARMGSSRLPNKVMLKLGNKDRVLIGLLLSRLTQSKLIDEIVLASSTNKENDPLCDYVSTLGYQVFRGDENDVLKRFRQAAVKYQGNTIVRITGDSPLIDAEICDKLIEFHHRKNADYSYLSEHFCEGVDCEIITINALLAADKNAKKASEREHVTLYTYNNYDNTANNHCVMLENSQDDSHYRFTVDNIEDAYLVGHIIDHFGDNIEQTNTEQIKQYLTNTPSVYALNQDIIRNEGLLKSLAAEKKIKT